MGSCIGRERFRHSSCAVWESARTVLHGPHGAYQGHLELTVFVAQKRLLLGDAFFAALCSTRVWARCLLADAWVSAIGMCLAGAHGVRGRVRSGRQRVTPIAGLRFST